MKPTAPDDLEVLPPDHRANPVGFGPGTGDPRQQALSHLIAYVMDNLLKVPGTQRARVGLNPILDLIPFGVGDAGATIVQALTIVEAARRKVPKIVLARMALNVLLNGAMGVLPVVGEVFSFWYRPSSRNYNLLLKHAPQDSPVGTPTPRGTAGEWVFVIGLLAVVLIVMGLFIGLGIHILALLWHALSGRA